MTRPTATGNFVIPILITDDNLLVQTQGVEWVNVWLLHEDVHITRDQFIDHAQAEIEAVDNPRPGDSEKSITQQSSKLFPVELANGNVVPSRVIHLTDIVAWAINHGYLMSTGYDSRRLFELPEHRRPYRPKRLDREI